MKDAEPFQIPSDWQKFMPVGCFQRKREEPEAAVSRRIYVCEWGSIRVEPRSLRRNNLSGWSEKSPLNGKKEIRQRCIWQKQNAIAMRHRRPRHTFQEQMREIGVLELEYWRDDRKNIE